jgi:hypothetical protein
MKEKMTTHEMTGWARSVLVGVLFTVACSSTTAKNVGAGGAGNGEGGATAVAGEGAGASAGQGESGAADGESGAAGSLGDAGASAATGAAARGIIDLTQGHISTSFNYSVDAAFTRFPSSQPANGIVCTAATIGACATSVCTFPDSDGGSPLAVTGTPLDAGTITVSGPGASLAMLTFGPLPQQMNQQGYATASGMTQFFSGGDSLSVVGSGGTDLPAFTAQKVVAPNDVVLTAPACTGLACPDLDRTQDLAIGWTGGGAGYFSADFETVGSTSSSAVLCKFDAKGGAGTVPEAALALLGDTRDGVTTGVEIFLTSNEVTFDVGAIPTTFSVLGAGSEALITVSR